MTDANSNPVLSYFQPVHRRWITLRIGRIDEKSCTQSLPPPCRCAFISENISTEARAVCWIFHVRNAYVIVELLILVALCTRDDSRAPRATDAQFKLCHPLASNKSTFRKWYSWNSGGFKRAFRCFSRLWKSMVFVVEFAICFCVWP